MSASHFSYRPLEISAEENGHLPIIFPRECRRAMILFPICGGGINMDAFKLLVLDDGEYDA